MKAKDLETKNVEDLNKELHELLKAAFSLRMQKATQQLTNSSEIRKVRRDIARVKTVLAKKASTNV
jgi:large subunit ribosomal protein L29